MSKPTEFLEDFLDRVAALHAERGSFFEKDAETLRKLAEIMREWNVQDLDDLRSYLKMGEQS